MTQPPSASSGGAAPLSLVQRFFGVLTSPKSTFESVVSFPRWFGIFALSIVISTVATSAFFWSPTGQEALRVQTRESNPQLNDQQVEMGVTVAKIATPIAIPIFGLLMQMAISGILMGVFALTGGTASFKQVLAVVAHAGVVTTVAGVFNMIGNFVRGSTVPLTSLAGFGQIFAEKSFGAFAFSALDLVWFWWFFALAVGLSVLYRKRTAPIFMSLAGLYITIVVVIAAVRTAMAGGS